MNTRLLHRAAGALLLSCLAAQPARAQQLFPSLLAPSFRNASDPRSEYTGWDVFQQAYNQPNYGDVAHSASNPSLTQTLNPDAFITSGFNIYSFSAATGYVVADNTAGQPVTSVVFQFDTLGTLIDYNSIRLNFGGSNSQAPLNLISENRSINGGFGGLTNRVAAQWNLTGQNVQNFTITYRALGSSNSFNAASLDTFTGAFSEVVPSARTWTNGAGNGQWGTASNWSANTLPSVGGNVTFGPGSGPGAALDATREVGELHLAQAGGFVISANNSAVLRINTGITADGGGASTVSAPVFLGGHGLMTVATGNTLTLSGVVDGAPAAGSYPAAGILKDGGGTLALTADNTFMGSVSVVGGKLILAGVNQFTGNVSVAQGELNVRRNAPAGAPGALGNSTANVALAADPATAGVLAEASITIEGNYGVGRNIGVSAGANPKALAARNATAAVFSGDVAVGGSNLTLRAEGAGDAVSFTGQITGGDAAVPLTKTGAGTVVFSGADKTYNNLTSVNAGTLRLAAGTALTGRGAVAVGAGATLTVNGTLGAGAGAALTVNGTLGGAGSVNRAFTLAGGGALSPGDGVGTINTVSQTWAGGGILRLEFSNAAGAAGAGHDLVSLNGALTLSATSDSPFVLRLQTLALGGGPGALADFNPGSAYSWQIAGASGGISGFATGSQFAVDSSGFANANGTFSVSQLGNNLLLQYSPAPEPSTWLMLLAGGTAWVAFIHQRKRRA